MSFAGLSVEGVSRKEDHGEKTIKKNKSPA